MANKYVRHNATYNGDGTTSALAASDGAAGAWNNLLNVLSGSPGQGSLSAGDTVYIKSDDESGGGDITVTTTSSFSSAQGTSFAPSGVISFVVDDGTIWASPGNIYIQNGNSSGYAIIFRNFVRFNGRNRTTFRSLYTGNLFHFYFQVYAACIENCVIVAGYSASSTHRNVMRLAYSDYQSLLKNITIEKQAPCHSSGNYFMDATAGTFKFENLFIDDQSATGTNQILFYQQTSESFAIDVKGLEWTGARDGDSLCVAGGNAKVQIIDMSAPFASCYEGFVATAEPGSGAQDGWYVKKVGDKEEYIHGNALYQQQWIAGDNYPTLNAVLPEGTPWSVQFYGKYVSAVHPGHIYTARKRWNQSDDEIAITAELLIRNNFSNVDKNSFWIDVGYMDENDNWRSETTHEDELTPNSLATSTASWSTTTYGANTYDRHKIELTTTYKVKEGTSILVCCRTKERAPDSTSFCFFCPDPVLEATP